MTPAGIIVSIYGIGLRSDSQTDINKMDPARLNQFAEAYAPEVLAAAREFRYYLQPGEVVEEFALTAALEMLTIIQRDGVVAVEHYHMNKQGGAFARACAALGINNDRASITNFLEGL